MYSKSLSGFWSCNKNVIAYFTAIAVLVILLSNLLYLPGPGSLKTIAIYSHICVTGLSILCLISFPFLFIGLFISFFLLKEFRKTISLILIGSTLVLLNTTMINRLFMNYSREYTIRESSHLIHSIEVFRLSNERYPQAISDLVPDYQKEALAPGIIGISRISYSEIGDSFELEFRQFSGTGFNPEIVIYSPKGEQFSRGNLPQLYETSEENWKYFYFD